MKSQYYLQEPNFRVGNIDVQSVSRPKNYKHSFKNGREKHGFIYVAEGKLLDFFQNAAIESLCAVAGELIFIPRGSVYTGVYLEENTKIHIIQFDLISGSLPDYLSAPTKIALAHRHELMDAIFDPIESGASYHPFYYLSRLYELLWRIDESCARMPKRLERLEPALADMLKHRGENKKISYYAELCGMSETSFRRSFRAYTGMSPIAYRNDIRLSDARSKLQSGEYNVSEVAYESGFTNLSFFIRLYKKKYGHTPKSE